MRLGKTYGDSRLEAACTRALRYKTASYTSVKSILKNGLDRTPLEGASPVCKPIDHPNIRGSAYYEGDKEC